MHSSYSTLGCACSFKYQSKLLITGNEMKAHSNLIYSNCIVILKFGKVITLRSSKRFTDLLIFEAKIVIKISTNWI